MNSLQEDESKFLNLYFQVHQPRRLGQFQFFDIGSDTPYFDDGLNKEIVCRIADECYLPATRMLLKLIEKFPELRITFSISGVALEQFQLYAPSVIKSFRRLAETGCVEFLGETYYHSLSYFIDRKEFMEQVKLHRRKVYELFGFWPKVARNTELIYSNDIGETFADLNFRGVVIDGIESALNGKTPNALYRHPSKPLILFPRNFRLSDDIAFRYSDRNWRDWPLTPAKFSGWLESISSDDQFVCLGMDFETFGEHQKANTGIFDFFQDWISLVVRQGRFTFTTLSEIRGEMSSLQPIATTKPISWADEARDLSGWLGNNMQRDAFDSLYKFHRSIIASENESLIHAYRHLQTSDHFYYMSTKQGPDGNVHQHFSPYKSPYEAFMNYMNVIADLELRLADSERSIHTMENRPTDARAYA
jgi:alpha-amylase